MTLELILVAVPMTPHKSDGRSPRIPTFAAFDCLSALVERYAGRKSLTAIPDIARLAIGNNREPHV